MFAVGAEAVSVVDWLVQLAANGAVGRCSIGWRTSVGLRQSTPWELWGSAIAAKLDETEREALFAAITAKFMDGSFAALTVGVFTLEDFSGTVALSEGGLCDGKLLLVPGAR